MTIYVERYQCIKESMIPVMNRLLNSVNLTPIDWNRFIMMQPYTYNYNLILSEREELNREIIAAAYHPDRITKWLDAGFDIEDYLQ